MMRKHKRLLENKAQEAHNFQGRKENIVNTICLDNETANTPIGSVVKTDMSPSNGLSCRLF